MTAPTVLYVEDEENDVFFLKRAFRKNNAQLILQTVGDGRSAIDYLSGRAQYGDRVKFPLPDVVLLDINLPSCSGFDVLRWLRQQPQLNSLPVVMFSSSARQEDRENARALGANSFLEKPISGLGFQGLAEKFYRDWLLTSEPGRQVTPEDYRKVQHPKPAVPANPE